MKKFTANIIKTVYKGDILYSIEYIFWINIFGHIVNLKKRKGYFYFNTPDEAERYLNFIEWPEKDISDDYDTYYKVYVKGADKIKKYGFFYMPYSEPGLNNLSMRLKFHIKDHSKYGKDITTDNYSRLINSMLFLHQTPEYLINEIIKIKKFDVVDEIIKSVSISKFDCIPLDKIKASSKEIEELKKILQEYYEKENQYNEFINKLLNKQIYGAGNRRNWKV